MGIALDKIKQLEVVEFDWKENNVHEIGLIAEDVARIIPEAVWYKDGKIEGIKLSVLVATLIKAIQEIGDKNG